MEKVKYFLTNEKERKKIVHNARTTIEKYHTSEKRADELIKIMRSL